MKNLTDFRKTLETGVDPGLSKKLGEKITKKHGKNSKKTTRRGSSAIWRIFAELEKPKRALSKMNLTSMDRWR